MRASLTSCQRCYRRKTKCDRALPKCGPCSAVGSDCQPAVNSKTVPTLRKQARDKQLIQELTQKVHLYEQQLKKVKRNDQGEASVSSSSYSNALAEIPFPAGNEWKEALMIIQGDTRDCFNIASSSEAIREIPWKVKYPSDGVDWFFQDPSCSINSVIPRHPNGFVLMHLWNHFRENVHPTRSIVDIDIVQGIISTTGSSLGSIESASAIPASHQAVLFAVYNAALTSMQPSQVEKQFNMRYSDLLKDCSYGARFWLQKCEYLRTNDFLVLETTLLFLYSLRNLMDPRALLAIMSMFKSCLERAERDLRLFNSPAEQLRRWQSLYWETLTLYVFILAKSGWTGSYPISRDLPKIPNLLQMHSTTRRAKQSSLYSPYDKDVHVLSLIRYEATRFRLATRNDTRSPPDWTDFSATEDSLATKLTRIGEFQEHLGTCLGKFEHPDSPLSALANLFIDTEVALMKISARVCEERLQTNLLNLQALTHLRVKTLWECLAILEKVRSVYTTLRGPTCGWIDIVPRPALAIIHLLRLCAASGKGEIGQEEKDEIRKAWSWLDANYAQGVQGEAVLLKSSPWDTALCSAWDHCLERISTTDEDEPRLIYEARKKLAASTTSEFADQIAPLHSTTHSEALLDVFEVFGLPPVSIISAMDVE